MKTCTRCQTIKPLSEFSKKTGTRLQAACKQCFKDTLRAYRIEKKTEISARRRSAYVKNPEKFNSQNQASYRKHRTERVKYQVAYALRKLKEDTNFKLKMRIRDRFKKALKGKYKTGSAIRNLGCSVDFLVKYLEKQFVTGMSWDSYGRHGWHIDHIMPLSAFDLTDPEQLKKACHYTNLQPLWATDNLKKSNK